MQGYTDLSQKQKIEETDRLLGFSKRNLNKKRLKKIYDKICEF